MLEIGRHTIWTRLAIVGLAVAAIAASVGCGTAGVRATPSLPANVMARPRGQVAIVAREEAPTLRIALRALGISCEQIRLDSVARYDLARFAVIVFDENTFDKDHGRDAFERVLTQVKYGTTCLVLSQPAEVMPYVTGSTQKIAARDVDFGIRLATIRGGDPMLTRPNELTREDLDSLGRQAGQILTGGSESRAILSSNTTDADKSALLLWNPHEDGAVWYLSIPIVARAAAGRPAEQKLLANLVSNK